MDEREFVAEVEAAEPEELARLLSRPTVNQEQVLVAHFGEERYARMHERALRRNLRRAAEPPRGNVVVLHGIMGSSLTAVDPRGKGSLVWVQALKLLGGGLARLALEEEGLAERDKRYAVHASGILKRYYGELLLALAERWRVRAFWYDWRKDLRRRCRRPQQRDRGLVPERRARAPRGPLDGRPRGALLRRGLPRALGVDVGRDARDARRTRRPARDARHPQPRLVRHPAGDLRLRAARAAAGAAATCASRSRSCATCSTPSSAPTRCCPRRSR